MQSLNIAYNPRIDQLRWFAATIVFLFHFSLECRAAGGPTITTSWLGLITEGHTGVGLFFTLSGFLFMLIALNKEFIVYKEFIFNRILRIFPLFLAVFLLATSISRDKFLPQDIFYLFATNLGNAPTSDTVITGAAWTISIEFFFYLIFPFLGRFTIERGAVYLLRLLLLMLFFKLAAYTVNERTTLMFFSTFIGRFDQFLIGMLTALFYRRHLPKLRSHSGLLLCAATVVIVINSALQAHVAPFGAANSKEPFWIFWSMLESAGWAFFIVSWVAWGRVLPGWIERALCHGGKISFSFYLLHMAVIHVFFRFAGLPDMTGHVWLNAAIAVSVVYAITWGLATLSYKAIEEPFLMMRRSYGAGRA